MKRICILISIVFGWFTLPAQIDSSEYWHIALSDTNINFYEVFQIQNKWFQNHPDTNESESGAVSMFDRWAWFWEHRADNTGSQPGNIYSAIKKFEIAYDNISNYYPDNGTSGSDWKFLGPKGLTTQNYGIVTSIALDPLDNTRQTIFAGTGTSGLWKTTDGGLTWRNITGYYIQYGLGVCDILIDPDNSDRIFLALGMSGVNRSYYYGFGILITYDGGISWQLIKLEAGEDKHPFFSKLVLNPSNHAQILAFGKNYIFRSFNSGQQWSQITNVPVDFCTNFCNNINRNWVLPKTVVDAEYLGNLLFVSTDGFQDNDGSQYIDCPAKLWKIENAFSGNPQFTEITFPVQGYSSRIMLDNTTLEPGKLFIMTNNDPLGQSSCFRIYSIQGGSNTPVWIAERIPTGCTRWMCEFEMSEIEDNAFFLGWMNFGYYRINNDGSITCKQQKICHSDEFYHEDTRAMVCISDGDEEYLYIGNDGGVTCCYRKKYPSYFPDFSFSDISGRGLYITQFYGLGICESAPDYIASGSQDNTILTHNYFNQGTWYSTLNMGIIGDAYEVVIHPDNPAEAYFIRGPSLKGGSFIDKTLNGFLSHSAVQFTTWPPNDDKSKANVRPLVLDPQDHHKAYVGYQNVYNSPNWQSSFSLFFDRSTLTDLPQQSTVSSIAISPSNPSVMFIGYNRDFSDPPPTSYLAKTTDGGTNWTCIYSNTWPSLRYYSQNYGITDIVVAPDNPEKIWISFGSFYFNNDNWKARVAYSQDGGATFTYPSDGLENLPVNCLSVSGTSSTGYNLFLGNDIGVFKFDFESNIWVPFNKNLPPSIVTDIEYLPGPPEKLFISTFGYGIWETSLNCTDDGEYEIINSAVTWDSDVIKHHNVYITAGGELTITAKASFVDGTGIYIYPQGRLIVNGGTLTSACGSQWNGVIVNGDPRMSMNIQYQGVAEFYNALVENAIVGVRTEGGEPEVIPALQRPEDLSPPSAGGIIKAINSIFRNNFIGVLINPCERMKIDQFKECTFEQTSELLPPYYDPGPLVKLNDVNMVHFQGCTFRTSLDWSPNKAVGIGILSNNSNFEVDPLCQEVSQNECILWKYSEFSNLDYGVKALAFSPTRTFIIDKANLIGNNTGIYASAVSTAQVSRCNFQIMEVDTNIRTHWGGLYLDECNGYMVEENSFYTSTFSSTRWSIGIIVNNSNTGSNADANNRIYNNAFDGLDVGILAENKNRSDNGLLGLQLLCNDFINYKYDIAITTENPNINQMGIKDPQGLSGSDKTSPAGNTFSEFGLGCPEDFRYHNEGGSFIYYHHDQTGSIKTVDPTPYYTSSGSSMITLNHTLYNNYNDKTICCPSSFNGGGGGGGGIEDLTLELLSSENSADSVQGLLTVLVDGGSTESLKADVDQSTPPEAMTVYSDLLGKSPYLTDTVLASAVNKEEVLTSAMVTDILSENPQSAKSDTVLMELGNRINQLTDDQMNEVMQGLYQTGAKEELEAQVAGYLSDHSNALNAILRYYSLDSLSTSSRDSVLAYAGESQYLWARYLNAFKMAEMGLESSADLEMNEISSDFPLTADQTLEHGYYSQLLDLLTECTDSGMSVLSSDSVRLAILDQLHSNSTGLAKVYAGNVLKARELFSYNEPYLLPVEGLKESPVRWFPQKTWDKDELKVYPNPAGQYVVIEYTLQSANPQATIRFLDNGGKTVKSFLRSKNHEYMVIPVDDLISGMYLVVLISDGKIFGNVKLIISR